MYKHDFGGDRVCANTRRKYPLILLFELVCASLYVAYCSIVRHA